MGIFADIYDVLVILKDHGADVDISNKWTVIEYDDGAPQSVKITLNTKGGRFHTKNPIIKLRDRIYVRIIDRRGNTLEDVFHVRRRQRIKKAGKVLELRLSCPHQSSNAWTRTVSFALKRISNKQAVNVWAEQLNKNRGIKDPIIEVPATFDIIRKVGNAFDPNTSNDHIYEAVKAESAMDEIKDLELQPVEGGGSFEAMYVRFKSKYDHATGNNLDTVQLQAFPQGYSENGKTARAIAKVDAGVITEIKIVNEGSGYAADPVITVTGRGTGAILDVILTGDKVGSIAILDGGSGYTTEPKITITPSSTSAFTNIPTTTLIQRTIESGIRSNVLGLETEEDPEQGTNIIAIGDKTSGSYPRENMLYQGAKAVFESARDWQNATQYKIGNLVKSDGLTYESIQDHTSEVGNKPPNSLFWIERTFTKPAAWVTGNQYVKESLVRHNDIAYKSIQTHTSASANEPPNIDFWSRVNFVPTVDYSPLTKDRAQDWINGLAGAKHAATNNGKTAMIDPNCVVPDKIHPRLPVRYVNTDPSLIPSELKIDGTIVPDGFLMLVIDPATGAETGAGLFAGNDSNGVAFAGNVAQRLDPNNDGTGQWVVFKGKTTNQDQEIADWNEGDSWTKNPCEPATITLGIPDRFVDETGACRLTAGGGPANRQTIWKKGSYVLSQIPFFGLFGGWFAGKPFDCIHSVKWDGANNRIDCGNEKIMDELDSATSAVFIKSAPLDGTRSFPFYVGFNIWPLWPLTANSIPFGSAPVVGNKIKLSVFDFFNMFLTHKGEQEWFGPGVEDYYPTQGFKYTQQFTVKRPLVGALEIEGDYTFGIYLVDINMNQVILDYNHSRNFAILDGGASLSKAQPYVGVPGASSFFDAQEPEVFDVFEPREWLFGGIYTKDSFDTQGRYDGFLNPRFAVTDELKLSIDDYRLTKPLVATNIDEPNNKPDYNIEAAKVKAQNIINYAQLKNLVLGLDKLVNFPRRKFKVPTKLKNDIDFGDPVYYTSEEIISDTTDSLSNTVKAVADRTILTLSKPKGRGPGAATRMVEIVERVWP